MKSMLEQEAARVRAMREDINRPQWKKVAGELLSSELEDKIEVLLEQSVHMQPAPWEPQNFIDAKVGRLH